MSAKNTQDGAPFTITDQTDKFDIRGISGETVTEVTGSDTFSGDGTQTTFTFKQLPTLFGTGGGFENLVADGHPASADAVSAAPVEVYSDETVAGNWILKVDFNTAPASGTDNVTVAYKATSIGSREW